MSDPADGDVDHRAAPEAEHAEELGEFRSGLEAPRRVLEADAACDGEVVEGKLRAGGHCEGPVSCWRVCENE